LVIKAAPYAPLEIDRNFIEKHNIDLVMHGDDFSNDLEKLCCKIPMELGIYRTVGYTEGISTTDLIDRSKLPIQNPHLENQLKRHPRINDVSMLTMFLHIPLC